MIIRRKLLFSYVRVCPRYGLVRLLVRTLSRTWLGSIECTGLSHSKPPAFHDPDGQLWSSAPHISVVVTSRAFVRKARKHSLPQGRAPNMRNHAGNPEKLSDYTMMIMITFNIANDSTYMIRLASRSLLHVQPLG
jgi:hypothetical protein